MTFFVLIICVMLSESVLGAVKFVTVPENARAGETVLSVWSAIEHRESHSRILHQEEVRCKIVDGNKNGRFRVTADCVVQVSRPQDYSVDPSYNLTVNVTVPPELLYVQVQVQDVEGYPPVYNNTCEMPIRRADSRSGDLIFDVKWQAEFVTRPGGVIQFYDHYTTLEKKYASTASSSNDCTVRYVSDVVHAVQIRQIQDLWEAGLRCLKCFDTQHDTVSFQIGILNKHSGKPTCKFVDHMDVSRTQTDVHFRLVFMLKLVLTTGHHFTCKLPDHLSVATTLDNGIWMGEIIHPSVKVDFQPIGCPPNKFGPLCDQNCTCENGARCHGFNGACKCQPGWQGVVCDIPHSTVAITATPSDSKQIYITDSVVLHCKTFHLTAEKMIWKFPNKTEKRLQGTQEDRVRIESIQPEHNGTYTEWGMSRVEEYSIWRSLQAGHHRPVTRGGTYHFICGGTYLKLA